MNVWESGRESSLLDEIISGRKTVEGRLNRSKFAAYMPGDMIRLRRDIRQSDGALIDGEPDAAQVTIVAVRHYATFIEMVSAEGFQKVIPQAATAQEAADEYDKYYPAEDQAQYGVLAIEVKLVRATEVQPSGDGI